MTASTATVRAYQATNDYQEFLSEGLLAHAQAVRKAQAALDVAEHERRVLAMIAVRAKTPKIKVAELLGVSRPTLDAWLATVENTPDEMDAVLKHEYFVARELDPKTALHGALVAEEQ